MADLNDDTLNATLWDESGNAVGVVLKNGIYRLEGRNVITSPDGVKDVTVTTTGLKERLDVNAVIEGDVTLSTSTPKWDYATPNLSLTNGVDTSFFLESGKAGFIDFIQVVCKNASYRGIIIVDGVEELRISMSDLGTIGLLSSNSTNIPIYAASASKIWSLHPNQPFAFTTSFELKVRATAAGNELDGWFVSWREAT